MSLTDAGEVLLRHAEAIVARLDAARADIAALRAGETGALRVGTYQSIGARVLPGVMRRFLTDWPGIELGLSEPATDPELYGLIESGELDLAFCSPPLPDGPFEMLELMSDPYVLLVPAESPLATRTSASLDDLGDQVLIGSNTCASGVVVEDELSERGYDVDYAFRSDDNGTVQGLVAAGFGVALVPLLAIAPGDARVKALRLCPRCRAVGLPSSGIATATARRPPAPSSTSPATSAPTSSASSSSRRPPRAALALELEVIHELAGRPSHVVARAARGAAAHRVDLDSRLLHHGDRLRVRGRDRDRVPALEPVVALAQGRRDRHRAPAGTADPRAPRTPSASARTRCGRTRRTPPPSGSGT